MRDYNLLWENVQKRVDDMYTMGGFWNDAYKMNAAGTLEDKRLQELVDDAYEVGNIEISSIFTKNLFGDAYKRNDEKTVEMCTNKLREHIVENPFSCAMDYLFLTTSVACESCRSDFYNIASILVDQKKAMGCFYLGLCYRYGYDTEVDLEKALNYFTEALNYPTLPTYGFLCTELASMYMDGVGTEKDPYKAKELYTEALNNPSFAMDLEMVQNGINEADLYIKAQENPDGPEAFELKKRKNQEDLQNLIRPLAECNELRKAGLEAYDNQRYDEAYDYFSRALEYGKGANHLMALMYMEGAGVQKNPYVAEKLCLELINDPNPHAVFDGDIGQAAYLLSQLYRMKEYGMYNIGKAQQYAELAAREGHNQGEAIIGWIIFNGLITGKRDYEAAIPHLKIAADNNVDWAIYNLAVSYVETNRFDEARTEFFRLRDMGDNVASELARLSIREAEYKKKNKKLFGIF